MKIISIAILLMTLFTSSSCAGNSSKTNRQQQSNSEKKVLVAYFSRTGENYAVGNIKKGNTHIVAEMIAEETNGKLFEIKTVKPYPEDYHACTDVAKREKESNARPALQADIAAEGYDVIFIGFPNWWGDMPMVVYSFVEQHDWKGKTVIPFCTHEGSGLSGTEKSLKASCKGANILQGLAIKGSVAQNSQEQARKTVSSWIKKINARNCQNEVIPEK